MRPLGILSHWNTYIISGGCGGGRGGDGGNDCCSSDLIAEEDMITTGESFPDDLGRFWRFFLNVNGRTYGRTCGRTYGRTDPLTEMRGRI